MTLGEEIISRLARGGQRGLYFDYHGYQRLRQIDTWEELERFLLEQGLAPDHLPNNFDQLLAVLPKLDPVQGSCQQVKWTALDPTGCSWFLLSFWVPINGIRRWLRSRRSRRPPSPPNRCAGNCRS